MSVCHDGSMCIWKSKVDVEILNTTGRMLGMQVADVHVARATVIIQLASMCLHSGNVEVDDLYSFIPKVPLCTSKW